MAKKKVRPTYIPREQRKAKERAKRPPMSPKLRLGLMIGGGVLAVALILLAVFYHGDNLPVKNGVVQAEGDNWIITNLSNSNARRYYKLGEVGPVQGFTRDAENTNKSDTNETDFFFSPDDAASPVLQVYISGVNEAPRAMAETVQPQFVGFYGEGVGEIQTTEMDGREAVYFVTEATDESATPAKVTRSLTCYLPAVRGASVLISVMTEVTEEKPALSQEELLEIARTFAAGVVFEAEE